MGLAGFFLTCLPAEGQTGPKKSRQPKATFHDSFAHMRARGFTHTNPHDENAIKPKIKGWL
jgi:hypothetical protein